MTSWKQITGICNIIDFFFFLSLNSSKGLFPAWRKNPNFNIIFSYTMFTLLTMQSLRILLCWRWHNHDHLLNCSFMYENKRIFCNFYDYDMNFTKIDIVLFAILIAVPLWDWKTVRGLLLIHFKCKLTPQVSTFKENSLIFYKFYSR